MKESLRTYKKALQIQGDHNKNNDTRPNAYKENKKKCLLQLNRRREKWVYFELHFYPSTCRFSGQTALTRSVHSSSVCFSSLYLCVFFVLRKKWKILVPYLHALNAQSNSFFLSLSFCKKEWWVSLFIYACSVQVVYVFQALIFSLSLSLSKFYLRF